MISSLHVFADGCSHAPDLPVTPHIPPGLVFPYALKDPLGLCVRRRRGKLKYVMQVLHDDLSRPGLGFNKRKIPLAIDVVAHFATGPVPLRQKGRWHLHMVHASKICHQKGRCHPYCDNVTI